jgi:hypothetical protein
LKVETKPAAEFRFSVSKLKFVFRVTCRAKKDDMAALICLLSSFLQYHQQLNHIAAEMFYFNFVDKGIFNGI